VLKVDRFGNLITNFTPQEIPVLFQPQPPPFKLLAGKGQIQGMRTAYGDGAAGELFGILGSMGYLEIAANQASAAELLGIGKGAVVDLVLGVAPATPG
jgi:S-adenosylmethionine hydrolase